MSNTKRDYRKFFTPDDIADFMVRLLNPQEHEVVLEPSAGNGALVKAVKEKSPKTVVFAFEKDAQWEDDLKLCANVAVIKDFLDIPIYAYFTSCIANPPFGNETDFQAHFNHICNHVKKGGRIVMIVPYDFTPEVSHDTHEIENWSANSDGTVTPIKIISFKNYEP